MKYRSWKKFVYREKHPVFLWIEIDIQHRNWYNNINMRLREVTA